MTLFIVLCDTTKSKVRGVFREFRNKNTEATTHLQIK